VTQAAVVAAVVVAVVVVVVVVVAVVRSRLVAKLWLRPSPKPAARVTRLDRVWGFTPLPHPRR